MKKEVFGVLVFLAGFICICDIVWEISHRNITLGTNKGIVPKLKQLITGKGQSHAVQERRLPKGFQGLMPGVSMMSRATRVEGPENITKSVEKLKSRIAVQFVGRLGNQMFEYASLLGIAHANNLTAVVPQHLRLFKYFKLNVPVFDSRHLRNSRKYKEVKACSYESQVMDIGNSSDVILHGYFQSWKYFNSIRRDLENQFSWKDRISKEARNQFNQLIATMPGPMRVGVHVRRGDMVNSKALVQYGYVSADKTYLQRAMDYFRSKFVNCTFIIASDEIDWCKKHIAHNHVAFVKANNPPEVDMAILSLCNHTVMTSGSFGWWSAWLAGGEVVYYKGYPRPGSGLYQNLISQDYRPPHWIGM